MDGSQNIDVDGLRASLQSVEHLLLRFTPVAERLLLDFRTREGAGPGVALLPPVDSFAERLRTIERERPGFPRPKRIHVVNWPLRVASLERLGVLETVRNRLADMDAFDAIGSLDETYRRLLEIERDETRRAIEGEGYHTIWPAETRGRGGA